MDNLTLKLKKLNCAYKAALEFDYCPEPSKIKKVKELFEPTISDKDLKDALLDNSGRRPDEIASEISDLIEEMN